MLQPKFWIYIYSTEIILRYINFSNDWNDRWNNIDRCWLKIWPIYSWRNIVAIIWQAHLSALNIFWCKFVEAVVGILSNFDCGWQRKCGSLFTDVSQKTFSSCRYLKTGKIPLLRDLEVFRYLKADQSFLREIAIYIRIVLFHFDSNMRPLTTQTIGIKIPHSFFLDLRGFFYKFFSTRDNLKCYMVC